MLTATTITILLLFQNLRFDSKKIIAWPWV